MTRSSLHDLLDEIVRVTPSDSASRAYPRERCHPSCLPNQISRQNFIHELLLLIIMLIFLRSTMKFISAKFSVPAPDFKAVSCIQGCTRELFNDMQCQKQLFWSYESPRLTWLVSCNPPFSLYRFSNTRRRRLQIFAKVMWFLFTHKKL